MNPSSDDPQITLLLNQWQAGDRTALDSLVPLVYEKLRLIARSHMRGENANHTFTTGDLVQEAYLKLFANQDKAWNDRVHFFAVAGRAMRNILINHAAAKNTQKRGVDFDRAVVAIHELGDRPVEVLSDLEEAINQLESRDQMVAHAVELRYFCGFTIEETADILSTSPATLKRKLKFARIWLDRRLG